MTTKLDREFVEQVLGYKHHPATKTHIEFWYNYEREETWYEDDFPEVSTDWTTFHELVVPVLKRDVIECDVPEPEGLRRHVKSKLGEFMLGNKTPKEALEWAMEVLTWAT